jgi:hypothetical protein
LGIVDVGALWELANHLGEFFAGSPPLFIKNKRISFTINTIAFVLRILRAIAG